jgi:hypothetical protein
VTEPSGGRAAAGYFVAALLVMATVAGLVVVLTASDQPEGSSESATGAFAPRYEGLEKRRIAAGVPTMAEGGGEHFHAQLRLFAQGEEITVPANVGIDPAAPPAEMAGLHTHDTSGTIHNEAGTGATLGDFFAVWGLNVSAEMLGPRQGRVRMWVDGEPSRAFGDLPLADGQEIVIASGRTPEAMGAAQ